MKKQRQNARFAGTGCARTGLPIFMGNLLPALAARACYIRLCLFYPLVPALSARARLYAARRSPFIRAGATGK